MLRPTRSDAPTPAAGVRRKKQGRTNSDHISLRYGSNWNRLPGGFPASYVQSFMGGTETSLQTFPIFISSVGVCQSLFDSQATFTQVVFFSQEHTLTSRPAASTSSV